MEKVVLTQRLYEAGMKALEGKVDVRVVNTGKPKEMLPELLDADGLIIRIGSIDRETMTAAGKLKVIGRPGVGVDDVDVAAATELGIPVVIAPGANTRSVAEHAMALMFAASKDMLRCDRRTRAGDFNVRNAFKAFELSGKTVGLVGCGAIGRELARLCAAIGMKVAVYDPFVAPKDIEASGYRCEKTLDGLLREADVVSLHVPLTEGTRNLIGARELALMKPNVSRGGVVDDEALAEALQRQVIAGAASDVFESEPLPSDSPLWKLPNLILSPHLAGATADYREKAAQVFVENLKRYLARKDLLNLVDRTRGY